MILTFQVGSRTFRADSNDPIDLSIPIDFHGSQVNAFGVSKAEAKAYSGEGWVGDTRKGGSCNFESVSLVPHCNGTHTEGVGHLSNARISIHSAVHRMLWPATVISVEPEKAWKSKDKYPSKTDPDDFVISVAALSSALRTADRDFTEALVIRTLPNGPEKKGKQYLESIPPFFTPAAMESLSLFGVRHLLCDLPSVDRMFDEGKLSAHRAFWKLPAEGHDFSAGLAPGRSITELIYVDNAVHDGSYLLDLQITAFVSDAAPSRPILYPVTEVAAR